MKEYPILFSAPMVRALLDGSKTQTRRAVKHQSPYWRRVVHMLWGKTASVLTCRQPADRAYVGFDVGTNSPHYYKCPYGQPGSGLWVRETWAHGIHALNAKSDEEGPFVYAATDRDELRLGDKWIPSIHMFRYASRINLEITNVRVERLQGISEADAIAEGIGGDSSITPCFAVARYQKLWESINGKGSWNLNPWVWVIEFKKI